MVGLSQLAAFDSSTPGAGLVPDLVTYGAAVAASEAN